jgi:ABC-type transporter Mla subunit MlaD
VATLFQLTGVSLSGMGHCSCSCGGHDHHDMATVVILTALTQMEERLMATIDEFQASMSAKLTELAKDVRRALEIITAGTLSDAQAAAAQTLEQAADDLDAAVEAVAPEPPAPPAP